MAGPSLLWAAVGIIVGMPILWLYLIVTNREIAWSIPVFGETAVDKWTKLSAQLNSPGVFLFYQYSGDRWFWGMVLPITKIVSVLLTELASRVSGGIAYALFISYAVVFAINIKFTPYRFPVNNWLDIMIAGSNMLLTIVPICTYHDRSMPSWLVAPFTIVLCVGPLLAIPYSLFRKDEMDAHDATKAIDELGHDVDAIVDDMQIDVDIIQLQSIWQMVEVEKGSIIGGSEEAPIATRIVQEEKVHISTKQVEDVYKEMYEMIDHVGDASTTLQLTSVLKIAVLISTIGAGWLFGGVAGQRLRDEFQC
jgi:hypothetical protein